MKALSKFMFAENPINSEDLREFILHTEEPKFLVEVVENNFGYKFNLVQNYDGISEADFENILPQIERWWEDYLDWEESIDIEE